MRLLVNIVITSVLFASAAFSQSVQGNYEMNYVTVHYIYEVREIESAQDSLEASYAVTASWPSSAAPIFSYPLLKYEPGDTLGETLIPLTTPEAMAGFGYLLTGDPTAPGVAINIDLYDAGTFTINDGSTYPTTETVNCITTATIPAVSENGTWTGTSPITDPNDATVSTRGWGITQSGVFAQFGAPDLATMVEGTDYGAGTNLESWGSLTIKYTDATLATPETAEIFWEAHDGIAADMNLDENGLLDGHLGIGTLTSDSVPIAATAAAAAAAGITIHVPTTNAVAIGASGIDLDQNGTLEGAEAPFAANNGYLFDPAGADGGLFGSGPDGIPGNDDDVADELFQFTGYYFTYNLLAAAGLFQAGAETVLDTAETDVEGAALAGFLYLVNVMSGGTLDSATATAYGAQLAASLSAGFTQCLLSSGFDTEGCFEEALYSGTVTALGFLTANGINVNDSDHDLDPACLADGDPSDCSGRLIFEIDDVCIPVLETQRVNPAFVYTGTASDTSSTTSIDKDKNAPVAQTFELFGNYPNPFNPSTSIKFATEKFSDVKLTVYSILGEEIKTVYSGNLASGTYSMTWDGKDRAEYNVPSGMYLYKVISDNRILSGKMLLLK